jgi:signal transduction histidine kinase
MDASLPLILLCLAALASLGWAIWLRGALRDANRRAATADEQAAIRGRSLCLAAQELRGLAACMGTCPAGREETHGPPLALCTSKGGKIRDGLTHQLLRLADNLDEVAAGAGAGARTIRDAPVPLGPIVDAAIAAVSAQIRPGHRHWRLDPALRALTVQADSRALEGALAALLRRAASHSRHGDVIGLRWVVASETVALVVEDEGDGLAAPDIVPDTTAPAAGTRGLDLGLSLARTLAAAHGGDIRLETAPGIGARAWLTLPRARLLDAA